MSDYGKFTEQQVLDMAWTQSSWLEPDGEDLYERMRDSFDEYEGDNGLEEGDAAELYDLACDKFDVRFEAKVIRRSDGKVMDLNVESTNEKGE